MCISLAPRPRVAMEDGTNNPHDQTRQEEVVTSDDGRKSTGKSEKPTKVGNTKIIIDEGGDSNNERQ